MTYKALSLGLLVTFMAGCGEDTSTTYVTNEEGFTTQACLDAGFNWPIPVEEEPDDEKPRKICDINLENLDVDQIRVIVTEEGCSIRTFD